MKNYDFTYYFSTVMDIITPLALFKARKLELRNVSTSWDFSWLLFFFFLFVSMSCLSSAIMLWNVFGFVLIHTLKSALK